MPFGDQHQFFASYTQELAAPRTDNLYQSICTQTDANNKCLAFSNFTNTRPETSTTYQGGYRFLTNDLQLAAVLWNTQVKNRIVSSLTRSPIPISITMCPA
jgi:iron complex outermembrane receptor protein